MEHLSYTSSARLSIKPTCPQVQRQQGCYKFSFAQDSPGLCLSGIIMNGDPFSLKFPSLMMLCGHPSYGSLWCLKSPWVLYLQWSPHQVRFMLLSCSSNFKLDDMIPNRVKPKTFILRKLDPLPGFVLQNFSHILVHSCSYKLILLVRHI